MKSIYTILLFAFAIQSAFAQQLIYTHTMDTTVYSKIGCIVFKEPYLEYDRIPVHDDDQVPGIPFFTYRIKGSNLVDIYSLTGKIGQFPLIDGNISLPLVSQKFIDDDDGWECLYNLYDENYENKYFKVVDDNGQVLLSDSGHCLYGFDGNSTYVFSEGFGSISSSESMYFTYKVWKFRTNVNSIGPSLSKTTSRSRNQFYMFGPSSGNFYLRIDPTDNNKLSIHLYDLLGRLLYTHNLKEITEPITISIPKNNIPNSAVIAQIKKNNGSTNKRILPLH